jgi:putative heme-binding domain-containing protein
MVDVRADQATAGAPAEAALKSAALAPTTCGGAGLPYDAKLAVALAAEAMTVGDAQRGLEAFSRATSACLSCHRIVNEGGQLGPPLTDVGKSNTPAQIAESLLWPARRAAPEYVAWLFLTGDGKARQGYKRGEDAQSVRLFDFDSLGEAALSKAEIVESREVGSVMPQNVATALGERERLDLIRFLVEVGSSAKLQTAFASRLKPETFQFDRLPLDLEAWPHLQARVNRDRLYDFYEKEALHFRGRRGARLLPEFPGLDGGGYGHWGNQSDKDWADDRWNQVDVGTLLSGVFFGSGGAVPKGVCLRLGEAGELAACFNPQTLCYEALWTGGFLQFSAVRHGFLDGLRPAGAPLARPSGTPPGEPFVYHGFYRAGKRVIFSYRLGDTEVLDAPWAENGKFVRVVAPRKTHPLRDLIDNPPAQWPEIIEARGELGTSAPFAIDSIPLPNANPWHVPLFCGDHGFLSDGSAVVCTMHGDVWHVRGLDANLRHVTWRRFASGLHQSLGVVVDHDEIYVLGRDQITRLHDLNGDGEADFYECCCSAMETSASGHDFICGLARDEEDRFYMASSNQGVIRTTADGRAVEALATGIRNPDGIHLAPDGSITCPASEGEWTPASMICGIPSSHDSRSQPLHFGYRGPQNGQAPALPLVYLPRGLDNSSGAQATIPSDRWGALGGKMIHLSYGAARWFLLLSDEVSGQSQGAIVPLPGEFRSGVHRGHFNPVDGHLYVAGSAGWGTYGAEDGCFQRVRLAGPVPQVPVGFHAHENGVLVKFSRPLDTALAQDSSRHFAQAWNYRYSAGYGSPELSGRYPEVVGHDVLDIAAVHLVDDRTIFLELPDLQPCNTLHLAIQASADNLAHAFVTLNALDGPFTTVPGYREYSKVVSPPPLVRDLAQLAADAPNPWSQPIEGARTLNVSAGRNLTFAPRRLQAKAGEPLRLVFENPDAVPHNWVLVKPGRLAGIGELCNRMVGTADALVRQYVPESDDVLVYSNLTQPQKSAAVFFKAPEKSGVYPFLCTFPGHWMVMNGELEVVN